ncbi:MAG: hypothetical protein Q7K42_05345 [Candidatus Diapherotrites archaeon]|nr:hypothetical protein [Candidatus Diapherotrites archaeon]
MKFFMNSKGQGGEVFKLLISAVVAFVILGILLSLLGGLGGGFGSNPGDVARNKINEALKNPGSPRPSNQDVQFVSGENIAPSAITSGTGITSDQICILQGQHETTDGFKFSGRTLFYEGQTKKTSMDVLCNNSANIQQNLSESYSGFTTELSEGGDDSPVSCGQGCLQDSGGTCCVVILKYARQG